MIYVDYEYYSEPADEWRKLETKFDSPVKASRFIHKIRKDHRYYYRGYRCDSMDENEEMYRRI